LFNAVADSEFPKTETITSVSFEFVLNAKMLSMSEKYWLRSANSSVELSSERFEAGSGVPNGASLIWFTTTAKTCETSDSPSPWP
jgi:hypothetical protein